METTRRTQKRTAFVPRIIFQAAATVVAVVPACVVACGGIALGPTPDAGSDVLLTVACVACGVADVGFDGGSDTFPSVAACGFDGAECTVAACAFDSGDGPCIPDAGVADIGFVVAACGFDGGPPCGGDAASDGPLGVALDAFGGDTGKG
jgi:hypothetical protein